MQSKVLFAQQGNILEGTVMLPASRRSHLLVNRVSHLDSRNRPVSQTVDKIQKFDNRNTTNRLSVLVAG